VVFPAVHGAQGEDGCLQGMLEVLRFPYVGSDVRSSAIAADKVCSKVFFRQAGLTVARDSVLGSDALAEDPERLLRRLRTEVAPDFVIKPSEGGSTIGISRVFSGASVDEFRAALEEGFRHDDAVLAEQYIIGNEVTCSVIEDEYGARALAITAIVEASTGWYDFQSKYAPGGSTHQCPAQLSVELEARIQKAAVTAHRAVGARDLSRSDFIISSADESFLLEINTLPGMTDVSLYPEAAQAVGISFPDLLDGFVRRALARGDRWQVQGRPLPGA
jgi:D-alanine-D-alanine ligase